MFIRAHNLKVFVLALNAAFKGIQTSVAPLFIWSSCLLTEDMSFGQQLDEYSRPHSCQYCGNNRCDQLSKTPKFSQSYHNFYKIIESDWLLTILISALIHVGQCTSKQDSMCLGGVLWISSDSNYPIMGAKIKDPKISQSSSSKTPKNPWLRN